MNEKLFQYIWQFQYFNKNNLHSTSLLPIQVINPGILNKDQGPDFLDAKIKIADTLWAGSIELHIHSSDWISHRHGTDPHYKNVILHVVWIDNSTIELPFPTIELHDRISSLLLGKYSDLMQSKQFIPCENHFHQIDHLTFSSWISRLLVERLQEKAGIIENYLRSSNYNWEEIFWWLIARNFGTRINGDSFENLAQTVSSRLVTRHRHQPLQIEALLLGQAGLLENQFQESYPLMLQKEFIFLKKKYSLKKIDIPVCFLRMRPANFPTIRLAQLAALFSRSDHLFSKVIEENDIDNLRSIFSIAANDYWHYHYRLDEPAGFKEKVLGSQMIQNILINTVIPVVYTYGYFNNNENYKNKALQWMEKIQPEKNQITTGFKMLGAYNTSAFDSQGLLQLKNKYCNHKRCLHCALGNAILKGQ